MPWTKNVFYRAYVWSRSQLGSVCKRQAGRIDDTILSDEGYRHLCRLADLLRILDYDFFVDLSFIEE